MPERLTILINGSEKAVKPGTTVAAAVLNAGLAFRTSVTGQPRAALCGMGACMECRVEIDGVAHERACMVVCRNGMRVRTGDA